MFGRRNSPLQAGRFRPASLLSLALLLGLTLVALLSLERRQRTVRLPDGRLVRSGEVTVGQTQSYELGGSWQRWLEPLVPQRYRWRLGVTRSIVTHETEVLVCRFALRGVQSTSSGPPLLACVCDDQGREGVVTWPTPEQWVSLSTWKGAFTFPSFPRRSPTLRVRLFDAARSNRLVLAEFPFKNPAYRAYPTWAPEPLPVTRRDADLECTLAEVNTGLLEVAPNLDRLATNWTEAVFGFRPGDREGHWNATEIELTDPTGNRYRQARPFSRPGSLKTRPELTQAALPQRWRAVEMPLALWLGETWKLRASFMRFRPASNDVCTIAGLPIPSRGETRALNLTTQLMSGVIHLKSIRGPSRVLVGTNATPFPVLKLHLAWNTNVWGTLAFSAQDDQGRPAETFSVPIPRNSGPPPTDSLIGFLAAEDATNLNLTVKLSRTYTFEWLVQPSLKSGSIFSTEIRQGAR